MALHKPATADILYERLQELGVNTQAIKNTNPSEDKLEDLVQGLLRLCSR